MVQAPDLKYGDPEFKTRSDQQLELFQVVSGSTPRLRLYKDNWFASCQLGFLTIWVYFSSWFNWHWKALVGRGIYYNIKWTTEAWSVHLFIKSPQKKSLNTIQKLLLPLQKHLQKGSSQPTSREAAPVCEDDQRKLFFVKIPDRLCCFIGRIWVPDLTSLRDYLREKYIQSILICK